MKNLTKNWKQRQWKKRKNEIEINRKMNEEQGNENTKTKKEEKPARNWIKMYFPSQNDNFDYFILVRLIKINLK